MVQVYIFHFFAGPPLRRTAFRWTAPPLDFVFFLCRGNFSLSSLSGGLRVDLRQRFKAMAHPNAQIGWSWARPAATIPREDLQREKNDICGAFFVSFHFLHFFLTSNFSSIFQISFFFHIVSLFRTCFFHIC